MGDELIDQGGEVTYVSGGPTEAGVIVIQVLAGIAAPLVAVGALATRSWQLLLFALAAVAVFVVCHVFARYAPHELRIGQGIVTFTRASGKEVSYPNHEIYVEKRFSNYGPDVLFCVKHSFATFRFPLEFTTNAQSGEPLTIEILLASGIELR